MKPVIIGAGLAGLTAALSLAPMPVILLLAKSFGLENSSAWAQGGIAAALGPDDRAELHASDTMKAGAGLCDAAIVRQVTEGAASVVDKLADAGVAFDRSDDGRFQLGLEGAHGARRIIHASGDGTGRVIMQALIAAVHATPSIEVREHTVAIRLHRDKDTVSGVTVLTGGKTAFIATDRVLLATGGAGALWQHTTNPASSWGQGLALAARIGAALADLEFMQFHPTAINLGRDPMPLASEALRGEGALVIDERGARFTDELAARDVLTRAIHRHKAEGHSVFLDARKALGQNFAERFPAIYATCMAAGLDPATQPIPIAPAAHYHMGGVVTDARGRASVEGLWACGEVACTGLHGANRLASNSLLEAAHFGARVAEDMAARETRHPKSPQKISLAFIPSSSGDETVRALMSKHVGVIRDRKGLETVVRNLTPLAERSDKALAGLMMATAALRREESRGAHARGDFPALSKDWEKRQILTLSDILPEPYALAAGA